MWRWLTWCTNIRLFHVVGLDSFNDGLSRSQEQRPSDICRFYRAIGVTIFKSAVSEFVLFMYKVYYIYTKRKTFLKRHGTFNQSSFYISTRLCGFNTNTLYFKYILYFYFIVNTSYFTDTTMKIYLKYNLDVKKVLCFH